ncbi:MAG: cysteine hydrolase [Burkholderiaceae bacterium]|nr:cysteine hydrolase [Burkholderiaceae bacterium]
MTTPAVLVIDVQQALCEGPGAAHDGAGTIARINAVTARARQAGVAVIFIQHEGRDGYLEHGTPGWQLAAGLSALPGDLRLRKTTPDSFHHTGLQELLQARGIDTLVICGMHTEFCVDTTTRRAMALGYPVTLVADGHTSAGNPHLSAPQVIAHHNATLSNISSFGPRTRVVPAEAIDFSPPESPAP